MNTKTGFARKTRALRADPYRDPDHSQNLIISSCYLLRHILKISSKSVHNFLSYLVHKQTDGQTNPGENITSLAEVISGKYILKFIETVISCCYSFLAIYENIYVFMA